MILILRLKCTRTVLINYDLYLLILSLSNNMFMSVSIYFFFFFFFQAEDGIRDLTVTGVQTLPIWFGSEVHDEIFYDPKSGFIRGSNNAGGLEGGITTGQPIVLRTAMKPLSTLYTPKKSVDILTKEPLEATIERSDICTVPAAGVVGGAVVAFEVAAAMVEKL